jgi:DNA-directed RNA polymerase specialized sigma24 family protein
MSAPERDEGRMRERPADEHAGGAAFDAFTAPGSEVHEDALSRARQMLEPRPELAGEVVKTAIAGLKASGEHSGKEAEWPELVRGAVDDAAFACWEAFSEADKGVYLSQRNDEINALAESLTQKMRRRAYSIRRDWEEAEDLTQDVWRSIIKPTVRKFPRFVDATSYALTVVERQASRGFSKQLFPLPKDFCDLERLPPQERDAARELERLRPEAFEAWKLKDWIQEDGGRLTFEKVAARLGRDAKDVENFVAEARRKIGVTAPGVLSEPKVERLDPAGAQTRRTGGRRAKGGMALFGKVAELEDSQREDDSLGTPEAVAAGGSGDDLGDRDSLFVEMLDVVMAGARQELAADPNETKPFSAMAFHLRAHLVEPEPARVNERAAERLNTLFPNRERPIKTADVRNWKFRAVALIEEALRGRGWTLRQIEEILGD